MAVIQGSWSSFLILRMSLKCLGSELSVSTAMDRWCHIHCWLYIAPILSSSLVEIGAGCSTVIGSFWIGTRPHSRSHSIWIGSLSPYVLFGNTLDMGMLLWSVLFLSIDLALFPWSTFYLIATCDYLITRYAIFYLFSHEISISPMLSQPSLISVLCMAMPSSLLFHSDASRITYVYASILCTAYLISASTAQGLGFALCIQYW